MTELQLKWFMSFLVAAVRNMALNESLDSYGFIESIFSKPEIHSRLALEDMRQLSLSLRLVRFPGSTGNLEPLISRLDHTVKEMTEDEQTIVSKFQQEVFATIQSIIGAKAIYNC